MAAAAMWNHFPTAIDLLQKWALDYGKLPRKVKWVGLFPVRATFEKLTITPRMTPLF
jgi:hypothetical protein